MYLDISQIILSTIDKTRLGLLLLVAVNKNNNFVLNTFSAFLV